MKTTGLIVGLLISPLAMAQQAEQSVEAVAAAQVGERSNPQARENLADRNCLRHTGSRITADRERRRMRNQQTSDDARHSCALVTGRSYTRSDLERTGAIDLADALRRLDPVFW